MRKGFTLAEVLITLTIIGVVAALAIPSVIVKTQQQEFKTAAKKAFSVFYQAIQLTEVKDGYTFANGRLFVQALINNMNVVKFSIHENLTLNTTLIISYPGSALASPPTGESDIIDLKDTPTLASESLAVFYTADGMIYYIVEMVSNGMMVYVDVNGDKGPTKPNTIEGDFSVATCTGPRCDSFNSEWPDINLTDLFVMVFYTGTAPIIVPVGSPG